MHSYAVYLDSILDQPSFQQLARQIEDAPQNPRHHFDLGMAASESNHWELAYQCFTNVTKLAPQVDVGFFNLGNACFELKRLDEACQAYQQAYDINPESGTLNNLGNTFAAAGNWKQALAAYDNALNLKSCSKADAKLAFRNLGKALISTDDWTNAIANFRRASEMFPDDESSLVNEAYCHAQNYVYSKSIECLVKAIELKPNQPKLLGLIGETNFTRGMITESILCLDRAFSIERPALDSYSQWIKILTHYPQVAKGRLFDEATRWGKVATDQSATATNLSDSTLTAPNLNMPLRVGILIDSHRDVPLVPNGIPAWLLRLIDRCDPTKMVWTIYDDTCWIDSTFESRTTGKVAIRSTQKLDDASLESLIRSDQIAVLIDSKGHSKRNRLSVFVHRVAPIQVSWGGFPLTSGLQQMDFYLSDSFLIPTGDESNFVESVHRLPSSICFTPVNGESSEAMDSSYDPLSATKTFRCGFLGLPETLNDNLFRAWTEVLSAIQNCELVFIGPTYVDRELQDHIRERFARQSIERTRIQFHCDTELEKQQRLTNDMDVILDSFPVNSLQGALGALACGIPVVTKLEERMAGRTVANVLQRIGRKEWIATDVESYRDQVLDLFGQREQLRLQQQQRRQEFHDSPICDTQSFAADLQNAILKMSTSKRHES